MYAETGDVICVGVLAKLSKQWVSQLYSFSRVDPLLTNPRGKDIERESGRRPYYREFIVSVFGCLNIKV